ncbi:MAG: hypothetical protein K2P87_00565 [Lachnospiraceae bacterium]|nr:hypothetical protein [Lachnospiraceae bacterium]
MRKKISFVAVGQAAGNIGRLFEQKGYAVLCLNTSQEDLDTLDTKFKYHIPQGEGCNKDRKKAKQLVMDDYDNIVAEIDAKAKADMVFVVFASGGGTGSGAGPMLMDLLIDDGRTVGAVTILPAAGESVKSHINSYECFTELAGISGSGACFVIDNEQGDKLALNVDFVDTFVDFLAIPEKHRSVKGNIDKAELMETLRAHGMAVVARSGGGESAGIIRAVKEGVLAPPEPDRAVKYIAASLAGNAQMVDLETAFGMPVDTFQTFNNEEESICCLSGLTYPQARLEAVYGKVAENKELIRQNLAATRESGLKRGVNFLDELEPVKEKAAEKKPQSRRDIMNKYL